jgi:nucleotide-binding universal stress UspA family protein
MNGSRNHVPIVVGVDETGSAEAAVDWATAEAATRGCPLRIVHAFRPPLPADGYGLVVPIDTAGWAQAAGNLVLHEAVARARSVASDIQVSTVLIPGTAARALRGEARNAELLVVGSRGRSGRPALLSRSVSRYVPRRFPCPVIVIPPAAPIVGSTQQGPGLPAPRVVLGIGPVPPGAAAIDFAFHAARQRGIPLTALSAWIPDTAADIETVPGPRALAEAVAGRAVEQALDTWRRQFPAVAVMSKLICAEPAHALVDESVGAALLVVGSRGRRHIQQLLFGSLSQTVLRRARCPVAVIDCDSTTAGAGPTRSTAPGAASGSGPTAHLRHQLFWTRRASR